MGATTILSVLFSVVGRAYLNEMQMSTIVFPTSQVRWGLICRERERERRVCTSSGLCRWDCRGSILGCPRSGRSPCWRRPPSRFPVWAAVRTPLSTHKQNQTPNAGDSLCLIGYSYLAVTWQPRLPGGQTPSKWWWTALSQRNCSLADFQYYNQFI